MVRASRSDLGQNRTTLVIAHRLSTIRTADLIVYETYFLDVGYCVLIIGRAILSGCETIMHSRVHHVHLVIRETSPWQRGMNEFYGLGLGTYSYHAENLDEF
eukprot:9188363-Pyramimonas_sp.AAC.2